MKKTTIFAGAITLILFFAVLFAFGSRLFLDTPEIRLPSPEEIGPGETPDTSDEGDGTDGRRIRVTPDTVQAVIGALSRPESYSRTVSIEYLWQRGEGRGGVTAQVWADRGRTRIRMELGGGRVRNVLTDSVRTCVWEDGDTQWYEAAADARAGDAEQRIPTYEDVLAVERGRILNAAYVTLAELDCIYVEVEEDVFGYAERYWVSVETGLLVCSETWEKEDLVYFMSSFEVSVPAEDGDAFLLPDGTVF